MFVPISHLCSVEETPYFSIENHLCKKQEYLAHSFPVKIEYVFERNTSCKIGFSRWREALFVPNRSIS